MSVRFVYFIFWWSRNGCFNCSVFLWSSVNIFNHYMNWYVNLRRLLLYAIAFALPIYLFYSKKQNKLVYKFQMMAWFCSICNANVLLLCSFNLMYSLLSFGQNTINAIWHVVHGAWADLQLLSPAKLMVSILLLLLLFFHTPEFSMLLSSRTPPLEYFTL